MSSLLKTNQEIAQIVKQNYVVVLIDVDKGHNADVVRKYGNPTRFGLPVLVVLKVNGREGKLVFAEAGEMFPEDVEGLKKYL